MAYAWGAWKRIGRKDGGFWAKSVGMATDFVV